MESLESRFYRPTDERLLAGVCAGLARGFGIDPTLVRLLWVLVTIFGGSGVLAYLLAWVIMPDELGRRASMPVVLIVLLFGLPLLCLLCVMSGAAALSILGAFFG